MAVCQQSEQVPHATGPDQQQLQQVLLLHLPGRGPQQRGGQHPREGRHNED